MCRFRFLRGRRWGWWGNQGAEKTTIGRTILRLTGGGGAEISGEVSFDKRDVFAMPPAELRKMRRQMQIIFQDPVGSLNPRMTVGNIIRGADAGA